MHESEHYYRHPSDAVKVAALFPSGERLRILDVGCGDGRLSRAYVAQGHVVSGMDANGEALRAASEQGIATVRGDIEQPWAVPDAGTDVVLLLDVLEHVVDHVHVLAEARRVLAPGGCILLAYPNHFDIRNRLEMLFGRGIVHWSHRKYGTHPWTYGHVRFLRRADLVELFRQARLHISGEQRNFMGGGVVPRRLTPSFLRRMFLRRFPEAFSGKFVLRLTPSPVSDGHTPLVLLDATPLGL